MKDCSQDIKKYYDDRVMLPEAERKPMRNRRDDNRKRLKKRQVEAELPVPREHMVQGSYAMYTMTQHDENDWDIDDGAVFTKSDLVGPRGGDMSCRDAKAMVAEALKDRRLNDPPSVHTNCVRIHYHQGYHLDIPVYRYSVDDEGNDVYELAGTEWRESNPRLITSWYNQAVIDKSPGNDGDRQMRRVTSLLKAFGRSANRKSWNMPSGLILSVLVDEQYVAIEGRDDESWYTTIKGIRDRLNFDLTVQHPCEDVDEELTKSNADACMSFLRDKLSWAIDLLAPTQSSACERSEALKCWKKVLQTFYSLVCFYYIAPHS